MRKSACACDIASRAKTAAKTRRLTLMSPASSQGRGTGAVLRHAAPCKIPSKPIVPSGSRFIALLHLFHGLLGVVLRIEAADQVHLVSGLVAEHLASLAVIADVKTARRAQGKRTPRSRQLQPDTFSSFIP